MSQLRSDVVGMTGRSKGEGCVFEAGIWAGVYLDRNRE